MLKKLKFLLTDECIIVYNFTVQGYNLDSFERRNFHAENISAQEAP